MAPARQKKRPSNGAACQVAVVIAAAATLTITVGMAFRMQGASLRGEQRSASASDGPKQAPVWESASGPPIHVVFCTDDTDLRGLVVAMKTAAAAASDPRRLVFHIVTSTGLAPLITTMLNSFAKAVQFVVLQNTDLEVRLAAMVPYRPTSTIMSNQELGSPFNLAPFFLDELIRDREVKRVLYLEPDVVVLADVAEIFDMDMGGKMFAAVKDKFHTYDDVLNMDELKRYGVSAGKNTSMLQRGVHLLDLEKYRNLRISKKVETWFTRYRDGEEDLWYEGLAGAPFNLIAGSDYMALDPSWNCFNLGEPESDFEELKFVRHMGFDHKSLLHELDFEINDKTGAMTPHLSVCSPTAKILHFSGMLKPWLHEVWLEKPASMCQMPPSWNKPDRNIKIMETTLKGEPFKIMPCLELWLGQLTDKEDCALKDFDKEWMQEELKWYNQYKNEQKRQQQQADDKVARAKFKKEDRAARAGNSNAPSSDASKDDNIDNVGVENFGEKDAVGDEGE